MKELCETAPGRSTLILLDLVVPQLGIVLEVVRCHPDFLLLHDSLLMKIRFTAIDKDQGIRLAIVAREVELLETRRPILVVLPRPGVCGG